MLQAAIGPLFGAIVFFLMFDASLLDPTYVDWLFPNEDSRMQFIGWHFFRLEPWHLPPGAATQYGLDIGSGIVFTDAVPLFAFIFKTFRAFLAAKFQYMGLWILTCYLAQGAMAWLLSGAITTRVLQRCVIVAFFVASPIMMNRAVAHHALMGHWLLLAALYLYVRSADAYSGRRWRLLLGVAALVHAYLLYMTAAIWSADIVRGVWVDRVLTYTHAVRRIATTLVTLLCTMWIAGYFTIPVRDFSGGAEQYGKFAANLNSFWNPLWIPTLFLSPRPLVPGSEIEGSNYLGVGIIVMVPIAAFVLLRLRLHTPPIRRYVPLVAVALFLWVLALSHQVVWDNTILFTVPVPSRALVAYYGLMLAVLAVVTTRFRPAVATAILVAGLAIQAVDAFPRYVTLRQAFHDGFTARAEGMNVLQSPFWQIGAKHYRRILFVPVAHKPPHYDAFAFFAADHGMAINVGHFVRVSTARIDAANATLNHDLTAGTLRPDSLYVFWNGAATVDGLGAQDGVGVVDGYEVIAPGWFEFDDCCGQPNGPLHYRPLAADSGSPSHNQFAGQVTEEAR
jgi:hypothetical protein